MISLITLFIILLIIILNIMKKISYKTSVLILFIYGILLRILYIWNVDVFFHNYDTLQHIEYIKYIADNFKIPDMEYRMQNYITYHPPLYYFINAIVFKIMSLFTINESLILKGLQCVSLIINIYTIKILLNIIEKLKIKNIFLVIIIIFTPTLIVYSGIINNDVLLFLLTFKAIEKFIDWYKNKNVKNMISIAICCSLGMMTKISIAMIVAAFCLIGLYILVFEYKKGIIKQYILFSLIFICGLWHNLYNVLIGKEAFSLVVPENNTKYITKYIDFLDIFSIELFNFKEPFVILNNTNPNYTVNYFLFQVKSFLFGEMQLKEYNIICYIIFIIYLILFLLSIFKIFKLSNKNMINLFFKIYIFLGFGMHIMYIYTSPYLFTMNARYIYPQLMLLLILLFKKDEKSSFFLFVSYE